MTTAFGNPSPVPAGPTPLTDTSGLPTPETTFAQPGVTQPTVVQPSGISGYLPPDILLPLVFAILVIIAASRPGAAEAVRALIKLFKGGPPAL
ncbi:hypothetical protein OG407_25095 [Streptomyces sp. NBC_01515]|uniref:hypothetical protein n=1 Tax=Streptomyces sp. NBC_01515 TaxID=2903890 RepID=UPI0038691DA7